MDKEIKLSKSSLIENAIINHEHENEMSGGMTSYKINSLSMLSKSEINERDLFQNDSIVGGDLSCISNGFIMAPDIANMDIKYLR